MVQQLLIFGMTLLGINFKSLDMIRFFLTKRYTLYARSFQKGFTLIELILYIAIVTIMMSALVPFTWGILGNSIKSSTEQEVYTQARYVSERIKQEIRNANGINSVNSPEGTIDLNTTTNATTVIDLSGGKIRIKYGAAGTPNPLNSTDTTISALTFTNNTSVDSKTKNISFSFTIADNYSSTRQEYIETLNIQSSAEVRSN